MREKIVAELKPNESALVKVRHHLFFHETFRVTNVDGKEIKIERVKSHE